MDLDELQAVKDTERGKDSLQHLPDSFYADVADHIASLKDDREERAARADDPFGDPEVQRLTGEIDATEQVVESIYERRVGKLVKLASFAAADMPADEEGLTSEERDLFTDLVTRIKENRAHVLDVLAGEAEADPADSADGPDAEPAEAADAPEPPEPAGPAEPAESPDDGASVSAADLMGDGPEAGTGETDAVPSGASASASSATDNAAHARTDSNPDPGPEPAAVDEPTGTIDGATGAPSPTESESKSGSEPDEPGAVDRTTLRITRDVGEIVGVDGREYELATDDVVTLPEANAGALVEREAAERLE